MATETLAPESIYSSNNYSSIAIGDIDEDPDSPDGSWGIWDGSGSTGVIVDFPTPTGSPTVGAGLQEFRVLIRKSGAGGNNPGWSLQVFENGSPRGVVATGTTSTTTGEVVSGTWNASALTSAADGSLCQLRMLQTSGGTGGVGNRRGLEVGACEWNVTYTAAAAVNGWLFPIGF